MDFFTAIMCILLLKVLLGYKNPQGIVLSFNTPLFTILATESLGITYPESTHHVAIFLSLLGMLVLLNFIFNKFSRLTPT
jgi:hypothetical protein